MTNKMKIHNAKQSAHRLKTEAQLLSTKIQDHLDAGGLHETKFDDAANCLVEVVRLLQMAENVLS